MNGNAVVGTFLVALVVVVLIAAAMFGLPPYKVWVAGKLGEAELRRAEQNRQIKIEEAKAELESAKLKAQSEVERSKGVAEANKIIGESLKDNEGYLRYLWINGLQEGNGNQVIYIPTECGLPILEAGRLLQEKAN